MAEFPGALFSRNQTLNAFRNIEHFWVPNIESLKKNSDKNAGKINKVTLGFELPWSFKLIKVGR